MLDTVRNEYLLHSRLYTWLMADPARHDLEKLNEKVYAKLFLTPNSDPWLGLFPRMSTPRLITVAAVGHRIAPIPVTDQIGAV